MYCIFPATRVAGIAIVSLALVVSPPSAGADQEPKPTPQHQHEAPSKPSTSTEQEQIHDHSQMTAEQHGALSVRDGSGGSQMRR